MPDQMPRPEFVALSTRLMNDLRAWVDEARDYYSLDPEHAATLLAAVDFIDQTTVRLAAIKASERPDDLSRA